MALRGWLCKNIYGLRNYYGIGNIVNTYNNSHQCIYQTHRHLSTSISNNAKKPNPEGKTSLIIQGYFTTKERNKDAFILACDVFKNKGPQLRGHVEFIYAALKHMEDYGVHKDLEVYKKLLDLMPKGKMIPKNIFQAEFMHFPKQQQCAIDCLEQMELHGVMPDSELEQILKNAFGKQGHPVRKFGRMMYWMPKFKNASPWKLPDQMPNDAFELARLAVARMCTVDPASVISVFETNTVEDSIDDTWIVSGQSPIQQTLIENHLKDDPLKVEGPFRIFLRDKCVSYFILRAEPKPKPEEIKRTEMDDVGSLKFWFTGEDDGEDERRVSKAISVHEQDDGTIMAICATGTSSRDSLLSWIRLLQSTNPNLANLTVLFTQASPIGEIITTDQTAQSEMQKKIDSEDAKL